VLQAEVLLADSKQRLLTAEHTRTLRASRINSILRRPLNEPVRAEAFTGAAFGAVPLEQAWAEAEQSNPDLKDMDARVRAKDENISAIRSDYLPTIYVSGGYEYQENKYQLHQDTWMVMAGVNVNLFAGGSTSAKVGAAKSEALTLKLSREKLLDAVRLDVQSAWLDLQSSTQKVQVAQAAVAQAAENLRLQRLRYKEGVGTSTDVLDAVTLMTTAETNAWKAAFGVRRAEAALQYSMGRDLASAYGAK
jgi:outer membrane protein TolC